MPGKFGKAIDAAANAADQGTAAKQEELLRQTREQIEKLFPEKADQDELNRLLTAVEKCTTEVDQVNAVTANAKSAAKILGRLAKVFV